MATMALAIAAMFAADGMNFVVELIVGSWIARRAIVISELNADEFWVASEIEPSFVRTGDRQLTPSFRADKEIHEEFPNHVEYRDHPIQ